MALIICDECGKQISDRASACIYCGCPIEREINNNIVTSDSVRQDTKNGIYSVVISEFEESRSTVVSIIKEYMDFSLTDAAEYVKRNSSVRLQDISLENAKKIYIKCKLKRVQCDVEIDGKIIALDVNIAQVEYGSRYGLKKIYCPSCGKMIWENARACEFCGLEDIGASILEKERKSIAPKQTAKEVKCPRCGSTQIQMVTRKWSFVTGIMTNKVDRVCMGCKKKF